jgi:hypothetical protein
MAGGCKEVVAVGSWIRNIARSGVELNKKGEADRAAENTGWAGKAAEGKKRAGESAAAYFPSSCLPPLLTRLPSLLTRLPPLLTRLPPLLTRLPPLLTRLPPLLMGDSTGQYLDVRPNIYAFFPYLRLRIFYPVEADLIIDFI